MFEFLKSVLQSISKKDSPIPTEKRDQEPVNIPEVPLAMQALVSPPDERDYPVCRAMEISSNMKIPADFTVWQPPVEDQGSVGNCVAQSIANIMECIAHEHGNSHEDYSVGYIYGAPENTAYNGGMYPREACSIAVDRGDLLRSEFECFAENPACRTEWNSSITNELIELAETRKSLAYIRINTKEEMQAFMLKYNLPVMLVAPTSAYYKGANGRHATVCYGWVSEETYRKDPAKYNDAFEFSTGYEDLLFTNSWGIGFHKSGRGACKFEDIEEIWGIVPMDKIQLTDIDNCWAASDIRYLVNLGIIKGYEDNTFRPENTITRAEMAALLARVVRELKK